MANDMPQIVLTAQLDKSKSLTVLQQQLKEMEKQLPAINLSVNVDGNSIKNQLPQIQTQINSATQTVVKNVKPVSLDNIFTFNRNNMSQLYSQLDEYKKKLSELSNFSNVKYSVNTTGTGQIDTAKFTYYNDALKQTVTETYKVDTASQEAANSINRMVLSGTTYSTNVSKYISDNQKLSNSITEITSKWNLLQAQTDKSGISLSNENVGGLTNALSTGDIQQAQHYMSLLRTEYQQLNATMSKGLPENAIENLNTKILNLNTGIVTLENRFKSLGNSKFIPTDLDSQLSQIRSDLKAVEDTADPQTKINKYNDLTASVQKLNNAYKTAAQSTKLLNQDNNLSIDKVKLTNSIEAWATKNSKALKMVGTSLDEIKSKVNTADRATLTGLTKEFSSVQKEAEAAGKTGRNFVDEIKNDLGKVTQWLGASTIIFGALSKVKDMVSVIKDLNEAATQIQMATGGTAQETANLVKQYNQMAIQLGATTTEVTASADSFLRQGKSISDTNELIKDSMTLSKIGQLDSADSTTYLTSVTKGYNIAVKDTMSVVDALSAVDMQSATSAGGLAEALSKTSNVANLSGVSMNKLIGYVATVGEVTQKSMDEVGTSFQGIFSRMGNVAANKDTDDNGESLNNVQTVLDKLNIHLRDSQGNFRNFGTVLDEVANKWKSYTNVEQNQIGTAIAGKQAVCSNIQ